MEKVVFHCASWLMDPQWGQLLDETSRIRGFQSHYEILRAESSVRGAARWLFNGYCEDPRDYPTDTSLRRLAVKLLLSGGTLNIGMGVRL